MERSLTQDEIDALFRAARGLKSGPARRQRELARCDFRQAGQLTRDQARAVSGLHEGFARNLGHVLGAHLRTQLEVSMAAIEQLGFGEFSARLAEVSYVASVTVAPLGVSAALQVDLSLALPMIDLMLGGTGQAVAQIRDVTEIEEQILESIVVLVLRELQQVWQPVVDLSFKFEKRQPMVQILRLLPPHEKVMALSFEAHLPGATGLMNVAFPAVVSTGLLRKLSESWVYHRRQEDPDVRPRLRQRVMGSRFAAELALPPTPVPIRELLDLQAGQVLAFPHPVDQPAELKIAGRPVYTAHAVRRRGSRAAQVAAGPQLMQPEGGD